MATSRLTFGKHTQVDETTRLDASGNRVHVEQVGTVVVEDVVDDDEVKTCEVELENVLFRRSASASRPRQGRRWKGSVTQPLPALRTWSSSCREKAEWLCGTRAVRGAVTRRKT